MEARQRVSLRRRSCQAAALASCCPICELKFPTKVCFVKSYDNCCRNTVHHVPLFCAIF